MTSVSRLGCSSSQRRALSSNAMTNWSITRLWLDRPQEKTDGSGTSIPCRALVYQEAPGPPVSSSSMRLFRTGAGRVYGRRDGDLPGSLAQRGTREVTDRHNSDQTLAFHHGEVSEVAVQHDFQGFLNRCLGTHVDGVSGHPVNDRLAGCTYVVGQSSDEIALSEDTLHSPHLHHQHGT